MPAKMTIGPVIGKVTDTTARVLVEASEDAAGVRCTLTDPAGSQHHAERDLRAGRPTVFSFTGLSPSTFYAVTWRGLKDARAGRVKTFAAGGMSLDAALVSCNFTTHRGETDLWNDLFLRYVAPGDVSLVIHAGDQIYGDTTFQAALVELDGSGRPTKAQEQKILQMYRRLYYWSWNHPSTQAVLANASNLMIWDDHEIRDDWGTGQADGEDGTPEFAIGRLARRVYREYQRQLWDDFDVDSDAPAGQLEDHQHVWGQIGIAFVDLRGGRSFERDPARPYMGTPQWTRIIDSLRDGPLSQVRALIVVTSIPLAYLGGGTSSVGSAIIDDLVDHWAYRDHQKEQLEMLRALRLWKLEPAAPKREVLVLAGDVHVGGHTDISHAGALVFRQLISSPITNRPPGLLAYLGIRALMESEEKVGLDYRFEHHDFTHRRNFGVIMARVSADVAATPKLGGTLVIGPA